MNRRIRPTESLESEPALLPTDPPARVARWTAWLLLGLLATAGAFACLVRLPEVVSVPFVLELEGGVDARLVARLSVPETVFPRLKLGQELHLRYNAYPSERYGSFPAVLESVSPVAAAGPDGPAFQATGGLQPPPAGSRVKAKAGMRGEARIVVQRQTILERVLEPLRATMRASS